LEIAMIKPPTAGAILTGGAGNWSYVGGSTPQYGNWADNPMVRTGGAYSSVNHPGFNKLSRSQRRYIAAWSPFLYDRWWWNLQKVRELGTVWYPFDPPPGYPKVQVELWSGFISSHLAGYWGGGDPRPYMNANLDSQKKALARLQSNLKGANVNLAVAFAERRQAASMLYKSVYRLATAAALVKRGAFVAARDLLTPRARAKSYLDKLPEISRSRAESMKNTSNNLANYWLEFQYGWRPLLSDIHGACELIAETYHLKRPTRFGGSATVSVERVIKGWNTKFGGGNRFMEDYIFHKIENTRYILEAVEDDSVIAALSKTGITNPLLVAWELVPYSFVIDWFLPVGNYLEQMTYAQGFKFVRGTVSTRTEHRGRCIVYGNQANLYAMPYKLIVSNSPSGESGSYTKKRDILTSFPYQKMPTFSPKFGVERALSAISLLTQTFNRSPRTLR
jgi:hypothetical protein